MKLGRSSSFGLVLSCGLPLLAASSAQATGQTPDVITLDGREYWLTVNPLETYFAQHADRRPRSTIVSSGNWRGYVAHFSVVQEALVVTDVIVATDMNGGEKSVLAEVFSATEPVIAAWFTGHLVIPDGKQVRYVHMGYGSEYSRYIVVTVKEGVVGKRARMSRADFSRFRHRQFAAFKATDAYREAIARLDAGGEARSPALREEFLYEYLSAEYMSMVFE